MVFQINDCGVFLIGGGGVGVWGWGEQINVAMGHTLEVDLAISLSEGGGCI